MTGNIEDDAIAYELSTMNARQKRVFWFARGQGDSEGKAIVRARWTP